MNKRNMVNQILTYESKLQTIRPLTPNAARLWYRLCYHANQIFWIDEPIILSEDSLRCPIRLSHTQFVRSRQELVDKGYILYIPSKGSASPQYVVFYLPERFRVISELSSSNISGKLSPQLQEDQKKKE